MWKRNNSSDVDRQLETLAKLAELLPEQLTAEDLETIFNAAERPADAQVQMQAAVLLSDIYPILAPDNPEFAQHTHTILLRDLR